MDAIKVKIEDALDRIRPFLQDDGGDVRLVDVDENMTATVEMLGSCHTCQYNEQTLSLGIEQVVRKYVPEILKVVNIETLQSSAS